MYDEGVEFVSWCECEVERVREYVVYKFEWFRCCFGFCFCYWIVYEWCVVVCGVCCVCESCFCVFFC